MPSRSNFVVHWMIAVLLSLLALHYVDRALFHDPVPKSFTPEMERQVLYNRWHLGSKTLRNGFARGILFLMKVAF
ncbi:hypothetical protein BDV19DRAFT_366088 [Aspergillus venezuelensis]